MADGRDPSLLHLHLTCSGLAGILSLGGRQEPCSFLTRLRVLKLRGGWAMQQDVREHQQRAARIETLIQAVATFPDPQARATTEDVIQAQLDMQCEGLARMLELIAGSESSGYALIETL